ncbi:hypothetical protein XYCOK13_27480 [Xylanibacillus composti]|uniref:HTH cro/C1-type domain-containing protein n=2 Tax=Xylanibacillus composti TaxID=1572762 RepID=A0A8J4H6Q9_9BACL|nr:hypothetical protein XYCOK13_27480 [Xylanibacillus composti]
MRRGRPKASNPRRYRLPDIRLTKQEHDMIHLKASLYQGGNISAYIRDLVARDCRQMDGTLACICGSSERISVFEEALMPPGSAQAPPVLLRNLPAIRCLNCGAVTLHEQARETFASIVAEERRGSLDGQSYDFLVYAGMTRWVSCREITEVELTAKHGDAAILRIGLDDSVRSCNANIEALTGYKMQEFVSHPRDMLVSLHDLVRDPRIEPLYTGTPVVFHTRLFHKKGYALDIRVEGVPDWQRDGRLLGFYLVLRHIGPGRRMAQKLLFDRGGEEACAGPIDLGRMLRMLMAERDINTTELSDKSGVSVTTISNLRNGRIRQPKKSTLEAVARALGVDSEVLESH